MTPDGIHCLFQDAGVVPRVQFFGETLQRDADDISMMELRTQAAFFGEAQPNAM